MTRPRVDIVYRFLPQTSPGAGAEFAITPVNCAGWLVRHLKYTLATSAVAANRAADLTVDDGTTTYALFAPAVVQAASLTIVYYANPGHSRGSATGAKTAVDWPTDGLWLPQGHTLRSATENKDAADQYSAIAIGLIEFPVGTPDWLRPVVPTLAQMVE